MGLLERRTNSPRRTLALMAGVQNGLVRSGLQAVKRGSNLAFLHPFCYKIGHGNTFAIRAFACSPNDHADNIIERIRPLNATLSTAAQRPAISQAERDRRAYAVSSGAGSTRLSGGILTAEAHAINARFVAGELTQAEWIDAILESDTVRIAE